MNKKDLVNAVATKVEGAKKKDIDVIISSTIEAITEAVVNGEEVKLTCFGSFSVVERAAKTGVNPRTGEKVEIKAKKAPKFKPAAAFKSAVNA